MKHAPHPGRFFRRIHPLSMHDSPVTIRHYRPSDLPLLRQITVESFCGV